MPAILDRLVSQLKAQGKSESAAYAIAVSSLRKRGILEKGSTKLTSKGEIRDTMTAEQRAKSRAVKYAKKKHSSSSYTYSSKTNRATLKKK